MTGETVEEAQSLLSAMVQSARWHDHRVAFVCDASQTTSLELAAVPESVRDARDFVRSVLESWNLGAMFDDVRLVVSELVTNALRYAAPGDGGTPIRLSLLCTGTRLTCAVTDPSDQIPVHKDPECTEQSGRGLQLVEAFSDSWNWAPLADRGKVVWACFACPGENHPG
jgi:anti-sigma regulatory factor (Ser/Thr protein kinase)